PAAVAEGESPQAVADLRDRLGANSSRPTSNSRCSPRRSSQPTRRRSQSLRRGKRRDGPAAVHLVDHVDVLVLPVRARDATQNRQAADRAESALLRQGPTEDELVAEAVEVPAKLLRHPVHVHLVTISDARW